MPLTRRRTAAAQAALLEVELAAVRAERDHLQHALASRIIIEQAKGVVAERNRIVPDEAFDMLRDHARNANMVLRDVCAAVIDGLAHDATPVLSAAPRKVTRPPRHHPTPRHHDAPPMPGPGKPPPGH